MNTAKISVLLKGRQLDGSEQEIQVDESHLFKRKKK